MIAGGISSYYFVGSPSWVNGLLARQIVQDCADVFIRWSAGKKSNERVGINHRMVRLSLKDAAKVDMTVIVSGSIRIVTVSVETGFT